MKISVFGLGYVGTVSAGCLARDGHEVLGVDPVAAKVELINQGRSPIIECDIGDIVAQAQKTGTVVALVPPGVVPIWNGGRLNPVLGLKAEKYKTDRLGMGGPRQGWSVPVAVGRPRSVPLLYWPHVHRLRLRKKVLV